MKVKLDDVILAFVSANNHGENYLHKPTGKIIYIDDPMYSGIEAYEELEENEDNWDDYIRLPSAFEIHSYKIMEEFIWTLPVEEKRDRLEYAIHGKGAFRRFKQNIYEMGLTDAWYQFEDSYYKKLAEEWCSEHNIDFE